MNSKTSLKSFIKYNYLILFILLGLSLLDAAFFFVALFLLKSSLLVIVSGATFAALIVAIVVFSVVVSRRSYRLFYKNLFLINFSNLKAIRDNSVSFERIDEANIEEFEELNELYKDINNNVKGRVISKTDISYGDISLKYLDEDHVVVTIESLKENIVNLIILSKSFRNALIDISYEIDGEISESELNKLINEVKQSLKYENLLIAKNENNKGISIYVPVFDSVSQLEEELSSIFRHISIVRRVSGSKTVTPAHICAVIYPYSAPESMFNDLLVAKRSEKPINIYMPNKSAKANESLLYDSLNINQISKASERLDSLGEDEDSNRREIKKVLNDLCNYFSFTSVGYVQYNFVKQEYIVEHSYSPNEHYLILEGSSLSADFVNKLFACKDNDNSYYFSSRKHVNDEVASFIDAHEIKSGLFYVISKNKKPVSIVYFVNDDKELEFDATIRQGLITIANKIGAYIKSIDDGHIANLNAKRFQEVLRLNNTILYSVDPETYKLFFVSDALKAVSPNIVIGEKCHKALYDRDTPCKGCPLKTKKHMVDIFRRRKFETSLVLHNSEDKAEHLLLTPMERNKTTSDLFSPDFLINSYYSLCTTLEDEFALSHAGEVIFMHVDNLAELIDSFGNDGYIQIMRNLFSKMKEELEINFSIYHYKNDKFTILLPMSDRKDVISVIESTYEFTKSLSIEEKPAKVEVSYYDFRYTEEDKDSKYWLNHSERVMTGIRRSGKSDFIYFSEDKYMRSASREAFMLDNVLQAFNKKRYHMEYQPIVGNRDRTIHGVELLMRLIDPFTEEPLFVGEAIRILTNNSRLDLVANAVKNCVDELFTKSEIAFFKTLGLEHMSLNMDYATLSDASFITSLNEVYKKHSIPKDFFNYEVPEKDLYDNYEQYKSLKIENASLVCDQYSGELLSLDKLKDINVKEVKISRNVILNIINDDMALQRAIDIWKEANNLGIEVTFVGVEKRQQADLLHDDVLDSGFQGRFFYSPMNEELFYKTLRESSIKEIADLDN